MKNNKKTRHLAKRQLTGELWTERKDLKKGLSFKKTVLVKFAAGNSFFLHLCTSKTKTHI